MHCNLTSRIGGTLVVFVLAILLSTSVVSDSQAVQANSASAGDKFATNRSGFDVEVWVEGPWAYAEDPDNAQRIVLIAQVS